MRKLSVYVFNGVFFVLKRSMVWCLFLFLITYFIVDYKKLELGNKMKLAHYQNPAAFTDLVEFLKEEKPIPKDKLNEYISYYKQFIKANPQSADAYAMLGFCFYQSQQYREAIAAYQKAIEINPRVLWLYYNLGVIYFKQGDFAQAKDYLKKAVVTKPPDTFEFVRSSKQIFLPIATQENIQLGNLKGNIKDGYRESYLLLILSYYHLENFIEMRSMAQRALITNVGYPADFYYYSGLASYHLKDFEKAITSLQSCIEKRRDHDEAFHYLGLVYQELGQAELSQTNLREAQMLHQMKGDYPSLEDQMKVRIY